MDCPSCGAESPQGMRFCGLCGAPLERRVAPRAERRQLTVLFSDLVDSTRLADRLDPEEYRDILREYQRLVSGAITGQGGHVAQFLGDGVLAYFGYPRALEDGADRAVRAALEILAAESNEDGGTSSPTQIVAVRIGIHTGQVVVGDLGDAGSNQQLALGSTPNIASRLQQLAAPGTAVISEATQRLLRAPVEITDLGQRELKGLSAPIRALEIGAPGSGSGPPHGDFEPTPMINRQVEQASLTTAWGRATEGHGSAILLTGEEGVGKSRTMQAFLDGCADGTAILFGACTSRGGDAALAPVREILRKEIRPGEGDPLREAVTREVEDLDLGGPSEAALLVSLLAPSADLDPSIAELTPQLRRRRTLSLLRGWLLARSGRQPLVLVLEDLHWSDPSTLAWLELVTEELRSAKLLLLLTARPEFELPWDPQGRLARLPLEGLEGRHVREMVAAISGDRLPDRWVGRLIRQTDGVPLYVEELTRVLLESVDTHGGGPQASLEVPATLQDLLMARLDRLGEAKPLAQWAATLGRSFDPRLLARVAGETDVFDEQLAELRAGGVLEADPAAPSSRLHFRQAMLQETAYRSLLRSDRREQHRRIAEVLLASSDGPVEAREIAHHLTESGDAAGAVDWWWRAADRALARSETEEGIRLLQRGLVCVEQQRRDDVTLREELRFKRALATALVAVKGYAAPQVERLHGEVQALARSTGDGHENFVVLRSILPFYLVRARHRTAFEIGEELIALAEKIGDPAVELEARLALATACFWLSRIDRCEQEVSAGLALYERDRDTAHALSYGQDPGVLCHLYGAWSCWWLGRFDASQQHFDDALALARSVDHAHSLAMALDHGCSLQLYLRRWDEARALVDEQLTLAAHHGFEMWLAMGSFRRAWLDCLDGDLESGCERLRRGIAAFRATGAEIARPLHLSYLAQAEGLAGRHEAGLAAIDEALVASRTTAEVHYEAELHRIRGDLLRAIPSRSSEALDTLRLALSTAREQGARAIELRTTLSLCEAAGDTADEAPARARLEELRTALACRAVVPDLEAAEEYLRRRSIC